jgi:ribonucleoside-diphosphate reductase alpha chain
LRCRSSPGSALDGDLAQVQPGDLMPDTVGKGEAESNLMRRAASNGFVRNKLTVLDGGAGHAAALAAFAETDIDGPLALSQCRPRISASNASAPPASRATKATVARNAATSP